MRVKQNIDPSQIGATCDVCKFKKGAPPQGFPPTCTLFKGTIFKGIDGRGKPILEVLPVCKSMTDTYKLTK